MTAPRTLDDWLAYISAQHPAAIALGLERVKEVWARMGFVTPGTDPLLRNSWAAAQKRGESGSVPGVTNPLVVTVGGTNGKGSTCAMLEAILSEAGYRVGLYTSPHITRYNERVRVGLAEATDDELVRAFNRVEAARQQIPLTYFEYGTLAALAHFLEANVEVMILEVGLGGRLDAVNLVDADVAIVVSVDLDHQAYLGNDRESIGFEKAGIFRAGRPAIFGDHDPPRRLADHAREIGARLLVLGRDYRFERDERDWTFHGPRGPRRALPHPALRGRWQLKNASAALAALDELAGRLPVSLGEVKRGLALVRLPGRLQVIPGRPAIVLDVAHNPHAARSLDDGLADMAYAPRSLAVMGMLADKDIGGVVEALKERFDAWYVASPESDRAASAEQLEEALAAKGLADRTRRFATVTLALEAARRDAGPDDRIVVFGSFYTVAEALRSAR